MPANESIVIFKWLCANRTIMTGDIKSRCSFNINTNLHLNVHTKHHKNEN